MRDSEREARLIAVGGVVVGVGFRAHVARLAEKHGIRGWVHNASLSVRIHVEGDAASVDAFLAELSASAPAAARITTLHIASASPGGFTAFEIRASTIATDAAHEQPDLPICGACLQELNDPRDRRWGYPYISCAKCGPRRSVTCGLPYARKNTTMRDWEMCEPCEVEYESPDDRRFGDELIGCPACGPHITLETSGGNVRGDAEAIGAAADLLRLGAIIALKRDSGYVLACDATNVQALATMQRRARTTERSFSVLSNDVDWARGHAEFSRSEMPSTPLEHLLLAHGAPQAIALADRGESIEPLPFDDADARRRLGSITDAMLVGERGIVSIR